MYPVTLMNINLQRKIDFFAGNIICRILSLLSRNKKYNGHNPKKILVILLSEMGSLVLARPMFDNLKKKYPEAKFYGLLFEQNKIMLELIETVPKENILTISNKSLAQLLLSSIEALTQILKIKVDTVIDCELFSRISSIFSFMSGAKIIVGFHRHLQEGLYRGDFINRPVIYNPYIHISEQFITMSEAINSSDEPRIKRIIGDDRKHPSMITFHQEEIESIQTKFYSDFPNVIGKKLVLIYPSGGLLPIRAWPIKSYCQIAKKLTQKGYFVAIIGIDSDRQLANEVKAYCNSKACIDLTGYTETVRDLMIIFQFASLLITNDGGPGHFASMTSIPSIIFYGPETPILYGPLSKNAHTFYKNYSCSPCLTAYNHRNSPCDGDNQCLKCIRVEQVFNKAEELLERRGK